MQRGLRILRRGDAMKQEKTRRDFISLEELAEYLNHCEDGVLLRVVLLAGGGGEESDGKEECERTT